MKRVLFAVVVLLLLAPVRAAEDFTGKWSGAFNITSPEQNDDVMVMDLKQKGTELTGTAGPSAERQWPLKGTVDGNKLAFDVQSSGPDGTVAVIKFALTFAEGHLKGEANAEIQGMKLSAKVDVQRTKAGG